MTRALLKTGAVMLAILIALSSVTVAAAQEDTDVVQPEISVLAVKVPRDVKVGELVTITVTERESGAAVEGASVWALGHPATVRNSLFSAAGYSCLFLGKSLGDGTVSCTFSMPGRFMIIATYEGYGPGLAYLSVKPDILGKLTIRAPLRADANETVTIQVIQNRLNQEPASEAKVWAITLPLCPGYGCDLSSAYSQGLGKAFTEAATGDLTSLMNELNSYSSYLGLTDGNGELKHVFTEPGKYLLVATKDKYVPGTRLIAIVSSESPAIQEMLPQLRQRLGNLWQERPLEVKPFQQHRFGERIGVLLPWK
ncbi:MAG TPA: DUF4198 domain-containing protein [Dehalococcoidia bacterium]|nr:DUF4198 domain-containing protein [Dehalococcoidia bacterium]